MFGVVWCLDSRWCIITGWVIDSRAYFGKRLENFHLEYSVFGESLFFELIVSAQDQSFLHIPLPFSQRTLLSVAESRLSIVLHESGFLTFQLLSVRSSFLLPKNSAIKLIF